MGIPQELDHTVDRGQRPEPIVEVAGLGHLGT
jgi:hypothetical protein